jgi:hypothetical protein
MNLESTHRDQATQHLKAIPRPRLLQKMGKSALGLIFIAGAGWAGVRLAWPWYVVAPAALFGAHIFSEELTRAGAMFVAGLVKDILSAFKGDKS